MVAGLTPKTKIFVTQVSNIMGRENDIKTLAKLSMTTGRTSS